MGKEIERKFLVDKKKWEAIRPEKGQLIAQGYLLNKTDRSVRIRLKGEQGFITVKGGESGLTRSEFEYPIPKEDAQSILDEFKIRQIKKTRFEVQFDGFKWEVDEFQEPNKGLILAEIELPTEDTDFLSPDWITTEVTGEKEYYNATMLKG